MPRTDGKLDRELKQLRKLAGGTAVRADEFRARYPRLYRTLVRRFRTFGNARRLAGLPPPPPTRSWSTTRVVTEMRRLDKAGVRITVPALKAIGRFDLVGAIDAYTGGIKRARKLARIRDPETPIRESEESWDDDAVVAAIQGLHAQGKPIAFSQVTDRLRLAARRYFGSYRKAVEAAGFDYDEIRLMAAPADKASVIRELRRLRRAHPDMTRGQLGRLGYSRTIGRVFESIDAALAAASIEGWPLTRRHAGLLGRGETLRKIRERHRHGRSLDVRGVCEDDYRLYRSACWHFSDWPSALGAARVSVARRVWSDAAILDRLRELHRDGSPITWTSLRRRDNAVLQAAVRRFGGLGQAMRAAGPESRGPSGGNRKQRTSP